MVLAMARRRHPGRSGAAMTEPCNRTTAFPTDRGDGLERRAAPATRIARGGSAWLQPDCLDEFLDDVETVVAAARRSSCKSVSPAVKASISASVAASRDQVLVGGQHLLHSTPDRELVAGAVPALARQEPLVLPSASYVLGR
jgi:hypothetical protein